MEDNYTDKTHKLHDSKLLPSAGSCHVCNCIRRLFVEADVRIDLYYNAEEQRAPCTAHVQLLSWFRDALQKRIRYCDGHATVSDNAAHSRDMFRFQRVNGNAPMIEVISQNRMDKLRLYRQISLIRIADKIQSDPYEQSVNPDWVDFQSARRWLGNCVSNHGPNCSDTYKEFSFSPAYLVDTKNDCVVQGEAGFAYVAISYRWGESGISLRTNKSNFASLTETGGLSKQPNIPDTIKHAMHVVCALGERYLWVDSLCIISDDRRHLQEQLEIMGSIYARAKLTIVSADGDAWDGLHGIKNVTQARKLTNVLPWLKDTRLVVQDLPTLSARARPSSSRSGPTSEYFQRGWTFQEYFLSRRRLIFAKRQIHWACADAIYHEDRPHENEKRFELPLSMANTLAGIPDFHEFELIANEYQMRVFTRPEDALPGFIGLLNLLKTSLRGGFLCGLPLLRFDAALMWNCGLGLNGTTAGYVGKAHLEARKHSVKQDLDLPGSILPSWSWVSWRGTDLRILNREEGYQLPRNIPDILIPKYITTPITTWYSQNEPFSCEKWRIWSFADGNKNSHDPEFIDQGWLEGRLDVVKYYLDGGDLLRGPRFGLDELEAQAERPVFCHPDIPDKLFWRPFSKLASEQRNEYAVGPKTQQRKYISCRTWRNWFHARTMTRQTLGGGPREAKPQTIWEVMFDAQIVVVNDSDQVCGWLQVPGQPSKEYFQDSSSDLFQLGDKVLASEDVGSSEDKLPSRPKIELVAICCRQKSTVYRRYKKKRQFYGVLWVTWKDQVAYREGCGFIEKGFWDEAGAEEVDFILG